MPMPNRIPDDQDSRVAINTAIIEALQNNPDLVQKSSFEDRQIISPRALWALFRSKKIPGDLARINGESGYPAVLVELFANDPVQAILGGRDSFYDWAKITLKQIGINLDDFFQEQNFLSYKGRAVSVPPVTSDNQVRDGLNGSFDDAGSRRAERIIAMARQKKDLGEINRELDDLLTKQQEAIRMLRADIARKQQEVARNLAEIDRLQRENEAANDALQTVRERKDDLYAKIRKTGARRAGHGAATTVVAAKQALTDRPGNAVLSPAPESVSFGKPEEQVDPDNELPTPVSETNIPAELARSLKQQLDLLSDLALSDGFFTRDLARKMGECLNKITGLLEGNIADPLPRYFLLNTAYTVGRELSQERLYLAGKSIVEAIDKIAARAFSEVPPFDFPVINSDWKDLIRNLNHVANGRGVGSGSPNEAPLLARGLLKKLNGYVQKPAVLPARQLLTPSA